jgi:hypothetical protein
VISISFARIIVVFLFAEISLNTGADLEQNLGEWGNVTREPIIDQIGARKMLRGVAHPLICH